MNDASRKKAVEKMLSAKSANDVTVAVSKYLDAICPDIGHTSRTEVGTGDGPADLICGGVVFETKAPGSIDLAESQKQLKSYLDGLVKHRRADLGDDGSCEWQGVITDGRRWYFFDPVPPDPVPPDSDPGQPLVLRRELLLDTHEAEADLREELLGIIDEGYKVAPPASDPEWFARLLQPFSELAEQVQTELFFDVKRRLWEDVLAGARIVPMEDPAEALDLFVRHTLLVATARLVSQAIAPSQIDVSEGFVAWVDEARGSGRVRGSSPAPGSDLLNDLKREIARYNWRVGRDILKDFYHAAIPKKIRHEFGEYYTPDWLATAVVEEVCDSKWAKQVLTSGIEEMPNSAQVLDPACGSGTFIYAAIKHLEAHIPKISDPEEYLQNNQTKARLLNRLVAGLDLHPVAVELARATKLLALGTDPGEPLNIWMGDSLQWSQKAQQKLDSTIEIHTSGASNILLPEVFVLSDDYERNLGKLMDTAGRPDGSIDQTIASSVTDDTCDQQTILEAIAALRDYLQEGRNGVWGWYLANIAQPFRLSRNKPSRLVGNPPWVVYNAMSLGERQAEFKERAQDYGIWVDSRNLRSQNDLAALFVATAAHLYLQDKCRFGFVLPYAALRTGQWEPFRTGDWKKLSVELNGAWSFKDVNKPPFDSAHSCVIVGATSSASKSMDGHVNVSGENVDARAGWADVKPKLSCFRSKRSSASSKLHYQDKFRNGATLFPESLVITATTARVPPNLIDFTTRKGKGIWAGSQTGRVENDFVLKALFSRDLVPFGIAAEKGSPSHLIAPIKSNSFVEQIGAREMNLYWNTVAGIEYGDRRKDNSPPTLKDRIDYNRDLTAQLSLLAGKGRRYAVVYNGSGSNLCAAVLSERHIISHKLNYFFTSADEAHYLAAIFNAQSLQDSFRQTKKAAMDFLLGPVRNIPIPEFDLGNPDHKALCDMSKKAHKRVKAQALASQLISGMAKNRDTVRKDNQIGKIMEDIDARLADSKIIPKRFLR